MTRAIARSPSSNAPEDRRPEDDTTAHPARQYSENPETRARSRATSYVTAPAAEPLAADDPLLSFTPVPHTHPRKNSITADRQRKFIAHLAATGIVKQAARHIGASLEALYRLRQKAGGEEFAAAWEAAVDRGVSRLEDCALARAIEGEERLVVSAGQVMGTERRHNEALVMFFLRNRRAQRYGGEIAPGHPVYDRIRRQVEADMRRDAADPKRIRKVQDSIARKVASIHRGIADELIGKFNTAIADWMAAHPGKVPQVTADYRLVERE